MTITRTCCLQHHGDPMPARKGIDLCTGHADDLEQDLNDTDLLLHLIWDMTLPTRGEGNRRGKPVHSAAPANLAAICAVDWRTQPDNGDHMASVVRIIEKWAVRIWRMHPWPTPENPNIGWGQGVIREHLAMVQRRPFAAEFSIDMHDTARMLRECAGEILPPIGRHKVAHPRYPERECGGRLYPSAFSTHDNPGVVCIDCGESYNGAWELKRLGMILDQAG